jgi:4-hydroxy-4-methyl-2-oxoglutarate aldolase
MRTYLMSTDLLTQCGRLGTSTLSDALDRLGLPGAVPGILPLDVGFRVCGPAFTGSYEPVDSNGGTVGDYIDDVGAGEIVVLDNHGRTDCTIWGDILTSVASRRDIGGTVLDGVCRDVNRSLELGYPVFSRGRNMQTGKDRVRLSGLGGAVHLGTAIVCPGDIVVGDADGIVVIGADLLERLLDIALEIEATEDRIREAVADGQRLDEVRSQTGYHHLQTRVGEAT